MENDLQESLDQFDRNSLKQSQTKRLPNLSPCIIGLLFGFLICGSVLSSVTILWLYPKTITGFILFAELPIGTIMIYPGNRTLLNSTTHRWLICDGSQVSRQTYSDLFSVIGTTFGSGNGNDTFNLPDFRFRFPLGSNDSQLTTGGSAFHTLTINELPTHSHDQGTLQTLANGVHTHSISDPGHNHGGSTGSGPFGGGSFAMLTSGGSGQDFGLHSHAIPTGLTGISILSSGSHTHVVQGNTGSQGLNVPFDKMPPYQTIHYIIRA